MYQESRYRARKKFYEKEENKEKKRIYMKEYAKRPYVIESKKKYLKTYNAKPEVKLKRHEWYLQKKIRENENANLNAINSERFVNYDKEKRS